MYIVTTSAAIYAVACIYTGQDLTPKKVINCRKAWKRLMINFFCTFIALFAYNMAAILVIIACDRLFVVMSSRVLILCGYIVIALLYLSGLVYLGIVWQLANVVSVLEKSPEGFQATKKSKELLKENTLVAMVIFLKMGILYYVILSALSKMYMKLYVNMLLDSLSLGMVVGAIALTIICLILLIVLKSLELVIPTVVYFDCKSYHHENVDKLALSDYLDQLYAVREEYLPLKTNDDIQIDQFNNV
ncbi:hypothetical protein FNV43_RR18398 [Rhamnella rubrinervis]|uniref:Uncharacterized protein n=1 Tax=Rhamnella rubrinervis TaxID=2594499 RepID=A0A8K0DZB9_9ROSA|nr:hypothetical protein FNV43_RR18398 [Rhamnella rubrinervis]